MVTTTRPMCEWLSYGRPTWEAEPDGIQALPAPAVNGRALPLSMGKVLGGGSSVNVMLWARGHRS